MDLLFLKYGLMCVCACACMCFCGCAGESRWVCYGSLDPLSGLNTKCFSGWVTQRTKNVEHWKELSTYLKSFYTKNASYIAHSFVYSLGFITFYQKNPKPNRLSAY